MKKIILFLFVLIVSIRINAQSQSTENTVSEKALKKQIVFDFSVGLLKDEAIESFSIKQIWGLGRNKQWRIGGGLRFSSYQGSNINYLSAPPKYWGKEALTDTVSVSKAQQNNLALLLTVNYMIKKRLEVGFNIDLVGYSFGADKNALFISTGKTVPITASANRPTALLVAANDVGMIRAEFNIGYWLSKNIMIRTGLTSVNTEYKTPNELQAGNSRFRRNTQLPFLAITFSPGRN